MKNIKRTYMWLSILPLILSSCGNSESKWSYTKEDMTNFLILNGDIVDNGDSTATISSKASTPLFKEDLDKSDIIVFNIDDAINEMAKSNKDYADYTVLKEASTSISDIKTSENKDGFDVTFSINESTNYGMLIHNSITVTNEYALVSKVNKNSNGFENDPQSEFEEKYVTGKATWEDGGKFTYQIISNIGTLVVGVATENPASIASGIFGILGTIAESFMSSAPSMQDVMNQLIETDRKIDALSDKIDRNTQQLADEIVRAEAMVDQANLNTLNLAINDFATNSIATINTYNRNLADEVGFYYRDYVKSSQVVNLQLTKDENGYHSTPLGEIADASAYNFTISLDNFDNSKAHLEKNNNIVKNGFMDEFDKDIDWAIARKTDLPSGIDYDDLRAFIESMIFEEFAKEYYTANKTKAQEYRNYMIDYAERINGASGKISILSSYLSRLQYMFNFAGEIKSSVRTLCANLLKILDMNTARASEACLFAEYNDDDLASAYKKARENIQDLYKNVCEISDSYSFTTNATLTGGFYEARYDVSYSNPGNHCSLDVKFNFDRLELGNYMNINSYPDDLSKHFSLSATQHARIVTRWNLLRSLSMVDADDDYIHYLMNNGVISELCVEAARVVILLHMSSEIGYRIITSDRTERELTISDTSTWLYCRAQGNPDGDYFILDKGYGYREMHDKGSWYGRTFEGTFVDAATGANVGKQTVTTWARYAESHWYWSNDEYWAFTNVHFTNYFFSVYMATE